MHGQIRDGPAVPLSRGGDVSVAEGARDRNQIYRRAHCRWTCQCRRAASARDLSMGKHSADDLKAACTKAGDLFSQDKERYGCGADCRGAPGTDCIVSCDASQKCGA